MRSVCNKHSFSLIFFLAAVVRNITHKSSLLVVSNDERTELRRRGKLQRLISHGCSARRKVEEGATNRIRRRGGKDLYPSAQHHSRRPLVCCIESKRATTWSRGRRSTSNTARRRPLALNRDKCCNSFEHESQRAQDCLLINLVRNAHSRTDRIEAGYEGPHTKYIDRKNPRDKLHLTSCLVCD